MFKSLSNQALEEAQNAAAKLAGVPVELIQSGAAGDDNGIVRAHYWFEDADGNEYAVSVRYKTNWVTMGSRIIYVRAVKVE